MNGTKPTWRQRLRLPETLYGFPVEARGDRMPSSPEPVSPCDKSAGLGLDAGGEGWRERQGSRGIALIIAIMIISVMMLFTSDLILSSQVNLTLATQVRDNLKAEYMAKSALNVATLLISSDFAYDLFQAQTNPKAAGLSDGLGDIWGAMNGFPIGGESMEMLGQFQEQFGLNAVMDSQILDSLKLFDGQFTLDVSDETTKINVNDCYNGRCGESMLMLEALFACPAEKQFLEQKHLDGKQLAYRIKDFIDKDSRAEEASGFNDENDPYSRRKIKQSAKNAPLDSINELRMIEGWDEDVHAVFSPYITAYPFQQGSTDRKFQININTASRALLQCLFPNSAKGDCAEKTALAFKKRNEDQSNFGEPGAKIEQILQDTLCYTSEAGSSGEANNKTNWFTQSTNVFRVEADGTVGGATKHLSAVVERMMPDEKKKDEKTTYRILYWKVI